jgi:CheY-like chemotaxis protein
MATVLMIDDVPLFRDVVLHALQRAGHQVACAANGAAAIEALKTVKPDLILLDLAMPEMNGLAFLRQLRADKALARTPVVVVSALSEAVEVKEATKIGVQGHLLKSRFSLEQLIAMVQRIAPGRRSGGSTPVAQAKAG